MTKEKHPYLNQHFDLTKSWEYLIIGTFPPNKDVREGKKSLTDYFYGNKGSLWKILGEIYTEFNFEIGTRAELIKRMKAWQEKYEVGLTDTLVSVLRKDINSADDSDLILDHEDYFHDLKTYILEKNEEIKSILFTSSKGCNSAYETFKIIMGADINMVKANMITNLPSPSGSSNTAWFNVNNEASLGLNADFYDFIKSEKKEHLDFFINRWELKKIKKARKSKEYLPKSPTGLVSEFKVWSYIKVLPKQKI
jgi:G:T/U-mismatch repair DNA glycosylase